MTSAAGPYKGVGGITDLPTFVVSAEARLWMDQKVAESTACVHATTVSTRPAQLRGAHSASVTDRAKS